MLTDEKISVVGLGKLGMPLATSIAYGGLKVVGIDIDQNVIDRIQDPNWEPNEPELVEMYKKSSKMLKLTTDFSEIKNTTTTFIIVPTPSGKDGKFSNQFILDALDNICPNINPDHTHMIVVVSTVMPGSMNNVIIPHIDKLMDGAVQKLKVEVCYNPEFIALGQVMNDLMYPGQIMIGSLTSASFMRLLEIYDTILPLQSYQSTPLSFTEAEIAKIHINSLLTTKITYANILSSLCERYPDVNIDNVTRVIGFDPRISEKYLKGGLGYGGPCFPRDNIAVSALYQELRVYNSNLPLAIDEFNRNIPATVSTTVQKMHQSMLPDLPKSEVLVGFYGIAYKENTTVLEESQVIETIEYLLKRGYRVAGYQPGVKVEDVRKALVNVNIFKPVQNPEHFVMYDDFDDMLYHSQIAVVAHRKMIQSDYMYNALHGINNAQLKVLDCWRQLPKGNNVVQMGMYNAVRRTILKYDD